MFLINMGLMKIRFHVIGATSIHSSLTLFVKIVTVQLYCKILCEGGKKNSVCLCWCVYNRILSLV
jgi:hypothetical protein